MKGFCFYQSLEAAIEKYLKAACHVCHSEENWRKTGGKPEENQRKSGGKHFENSSKKSIKKQDQNGAKKKTVIVLPITMEIQTT